MERVLVVPDPEEGRKVDHCREIQLPPRTHRSSLGLGVSSVTAFRHEPPNRWKLPAHIHTSPVIHKIFKNNARSSTAT